MGLMATALTAYAKRREAAFEKACRDPVATQMAVFRDLLARARDTEWGKTYGYADIRTPEEFRQRVPLTDYVSMEPMWHRAFQGDRDVTWPGHVRFFALSSGTTAGNKLLPVTRDAIRANRTAGGLLMAYLVRRGGAKALAAGRFLYLGGSTQLREKGKSLYGDASGIMGRHIPFYARRRYLPEADIGGLTSWEEKIDRVVERYPGANVCGLSACPSWAALLLKRLRDVCGKPVGEIWPKLSFFVSYGMSFEPYRSAFESYVGRPLHYVNTYSSSEGGMTAIEEEEAGPMRLIVDNGTFYEFIPAEQANEAEPPRLHIGEVEVGKDYAVVLNTNGGMWAYPIGDIIRFESLSPPRMVFAGRTLLQLSAFGEHVDIGMIENAMTAACRATGAMVNDFTIVPRYPSDDHPTPLHRWVVEFEACPADEAAFMKVADDTIRRENEDYDTHRQDDYGMDPPELVVVPEGTFYAWMKAKGKLGGQHKVPRVAREAAMFDELLARR